MPAKKTTTDDGKQPTGKEIRLASVGTKRKYNSALTDAAEAVDVAKEKLEDATDLARKEHLQPKPFKLAKKLYDDFKRADNPSIAAEKLASFLAHFDDARTFFKLDELANLQGRLFGTGPIGETAGEPPRETDEDGETDPRPRHLRQPGASAASVVQDLATKAGATPRPDEDHLKDVGRGPSGKPN